MSGEPEPAEGVTGTPPSTATWLDQKERGQLWVMQATIRLAVLLGRRPMRPFVSMVALWYRIVDRTAVAASRDWLTRVRGHPPGFWDIYRHLRAFAQVTLDKVFFLTGRTTGITLHNPGGHLLEAQFESGRGAILLSSHLGSHEAMRCLAISKNMPTHILGYFENAAMINSLLERLNPGMAEQVIHLGTDPIGAMTRAKARIESGGLVAVAGDRVGLNDRVVSARFLGAEAPFASGPFLLAAVLRCPVYLVFGIYTEPDRYDLTCEPFAERIELPRTERQLALASWVQRYADRLEFHARRAPDNWFNFFDFWSRP